MATKDSTNLRGLEPVEILGKLQTKATQLAAILATVYGDGFETFHDMNDGLQSSFMWLVSDTAEEVEALAEGFSRLPIPRVNLSDHDDLTRRASQLRAATALYSGDGFDQLQRESDEVQANVMWLLADLGEEVKQAAGRMQIPGAAATAATV